MAVEQRDVAELHNAPLERLIAAQCCRLTVSLFLFLTLSTHTDKIGARDEYIISLQMFVYRTFSLAKSTFRLESQFHRLFIHGFTDTIESQLDFSYQSGKFLVLVFIIYFLMKLLSILICYYRYN